MFVSVYRYAVPEGRRDEFLVLQEEVSSAYRRAGALATLLLEPRGGEAHFWADISLFESARAAAEAERQLTEEGVIEPLFRRFQDITGLEIEQIRYENFDAALSAGMLMPVGRRDTAH